MAAHFNLDVSLPRELRDFVADEVASGRYRSASEVVRAALHGFRAASSAQASAPQAGAPAPEAPDQAAVPPSPRELRYRAMLESAVEYAIVAFDAKGLVVEWNAGAEAIIGWSAADMLGREGTVIFTPEDQIEGVPAAELHRAAEEGRAVNERWHVRRDGTRFWGSGPRLCPFLPGRSRHG